MSETSTPTEAVDVVDLTRVELRPGDTLLVRPREGYWSPEAAAHAKERLTTLFPGVRVVVFAAAADVAVISEQGSGTTMPDPSGLPVALASAAARGDQAVSLTRSVPDQCWITLSAGTPYWEQVRVWQCTGSGPYVARLGFSISEPARLGRPHAAGATVEVTDD